jgi:hypothetical protein
VNLYGTLEKGAIPSFPERRSLTYFESIAQEVQSKAGQRCTVEIIPYTDSVVPDTRLLAAGNDAIRISHDRGLDQAEWPSEEQALRTIRETLRQLGVKEG